MITALTRPGRRRREVSAQISRAADLIETEGHMKYTVRGANGARCMAQALRDASGGSSYSNDASDAVAAALRESICDFNNRHSKDEVVAKLREIAAKA